MNANIYTNQQFIITRDGELTDEYEPSALSQAATMALNALGSAVEHIKLEVRMAAFDALHGTHYRKVRHQLIEQKKRAEFESSIGLVPLNN